jgi:CHAT domain-containing protein/Tfp pilus assembly protein PilF
VDKFFAAYQRSDLDGLMLLWSEKSPEMAASKQTFQQTFAASKIELKNLTIRKIVIENSKATVRVVADMIVSDTTTGKPAVGSGISNRTLHCVKEGEVWQVFQYVSSEQELAVALASAKTDEARKSLLESEKELVTVALVQALLEQGRRLHSKGSYQVALAMLRLANDMAHQLADESGGAAAWMGIGIVHRSQSNYDQALEAHQKSMEISRKIDDKDGIGRALNNIGEVHRLQGNYTQALEDYQKSLEIMIGLEDKEAISRALNNIGIVHASQDDYTLAREFFQRSLKIKEELDDKRGAAVTRMNIGLVEYSQGNYAQALEDYQKSLEIMIELEDKEGIASTLSNIGIVHATQNNYTQALEYFRKSLEVAQELNDPNGIAIVLSNIGLVEYSQGNYARALENYRESRKINEQIGDKEGIAGVLASIGLVEYSQGNYAQAVDLFQRSLRIAQEINDKEGIAIALNNIGLVEHSQGNYTQAVEMAKQSAAISEQIGSPELSWQARLTMGKAYQALNQGEQACHEYKLAIDSIEKLRSEVAGAELDLQRFFVNKLAPYHQMIQLLIEQNNPTEAFAYAERAKARALLDTLQTGRVNITKAMTADEQALERKLRSEMISLNTQIFREEQRDEPDSSRIKQLKSRLEKARRDYEEFNLSLYAAHPELKIYRGQMQPVSLDYSSELIPDTRTAFLEYVVTEDKTYLFVLTRKEQTRSNGRTLAGVPVLKGYIINIKQKDLLDRVEDFRETLLRNNFRTQARELFRLLLKPATDQLRGKSQLILVPDGPLWDIPFQGLESDQRRYLIEDHSVSYVHSLTVLREMIKRREKSPEDTGACSLLAMGDPVLGKAMIKRVDSVLMDRQLGPIKDAKIQLHELEKLYKVKGYTGAEASEERFKTEAPTCRILHLATHGILNNHNPMYSHLLLSREEVSEKEDGLLEAWELMNLDLKANLAVLSACDTARGRAAGEGVIGLSWALFIAGVPTTVVSQWSVESASTAKLMVEFHRQLRSKVGKTGSQISKAEALRRASLMLLRNRQYKSPYYWGGFIVVGAGY